MDVRLDSFKNSKKSSPIWQAWAKFFTGMIALACGVEPSGKCPGLVADGCVGLELFYLRVLRNTPSFRDIRTNRRGAVFATVPAAVNGTAACTGTPTWTKQALSWQRVCSRETKLKARRRKLRSQWRFETKNTCDLMSQRLNTSAADNV